MTAQTQNSQETIEKKVPHSQGSSFFDALSLLAGKLWHPEKQIKNRQNFSENNLSTSTVNHSETNENLKNKQATEIGTLQESRTKQNGLLHRVVSNFLGRTQKKSNKFTTDRELGEISQAESELEKKTNSQEAPNSIKKILKKNKEKLDSAEGLMNPYTEEVVDASTGKKTIEMKSISHIISEAWQAESGIFQSIKNVIFSVGGWFGAKYILPFFRRLSGMKNYFGEKLGFIKEKGKSVLNKAKKLLHLNKKTKSSQDLLIHSIKSLLKNPKSLEKQAAFKKLADKNPKDLKKIFKKLGISPDSLKQTYKKSTLRNIIQIITNPEPGKKIGQSVFEMAPITGSYHDVKEIWNSNSPLPDWAKVAIAGTSLILDAGLIGSTVASFGTATPAALSLSTAMRVGVRKGVGILITKIAPKKVAQQGGRIALEEAGKVSIFQLAEDKLMQEIQNNLSTQSLVQILLQEEKLGKSGLLKKLESLKNRRKL